ncbi:hypothetical protein [Shimia abyssi]|uniref:Uncharacterized protein n=1 Tax=Shimia abyssi TaxID=1662395 RepID=A0A2P8F780_9RHOB|nr:hypothetical protein [Shimia abyssi]PSL17580.1 hypothetical protein CLV88_11627 [Shimia abyssi]
MIVETYGDLHCPAIESGDNAKVNWLSTTQAVDLDQLKTDIEALGNLSKLTLGSGAVTVTFSNPTSGGAHDFGVVLENDQSGGIFDYSSVSQPGNHLLTAGNGGNTLCMAVNPDYNYLFRPLQLTQRASMTFRRFWTLPRLQPPSGRRHRSSPGPDKMSAYTDITAW